MECGISQLQTPDLQRTTSAAQVYFDPPDLGWEPYFKSWVENFIPANRQTDDTRQEGVMGVCGNESCIAKLKL